MRKVVSPSTFAGMEVHPDMDVSLMDSKELTMCHAFCHNSYAYKFPIYNRLAIQDFHSSLVTEMEKRGRKHFYVDILDKI